MRAYKPAEMEVLVPVVRCGECAFRENAIFKNDDVWGYYCLVHMHFVEPNDYCSWGERRSDE